MKTDTTNKFSAVEYMRQIRSELSTLVQKDKKKFHAELKKAMQEFKARKIKEGDHSIASEPEP